MKIPMKVGVSRATSKLGLEQQVAVVRALCKLYLLEHGWNEVSEQPSELTMLLVSYLALGGTDGVHKEIPAGYPPEEEQEG